MTARYLYIKFTGFLLVILGLSYSITSFVNMFSYLYGNVVINGSNAFLMILGTIIPLFIFIFGIFYFMYVDDNITKINKKILICSIIMIILGLLVLVFKTSYLVLHAFTISQIFYFLHFSLGYVSIVLGGMVIYSCLKYKI
jgi:hypothetical protein